jgi:hypothetical protein
MTIIANVIIRICPVRMGFDQVSAEVEKIILVSSRCH